MLFGGGGEGAPAATGGSRLAISEKLLGRRRRGAPPPVLWSLAVCRILPPRAPRPGAAALPESPPAPFCLRFIDVLFFGGVLLAVLSALEGGGPKTPPGRPWGGPGPRDLKLPELHANERPPGRGASGLHRAETTESVSKKQQQQNRAPFRTAPRVPAANAGRVRSLGGRRGPVPAPWPPERF